MGEENKSSKSSFFQIIKNIWEREGEKARLKKGKKAKKPQGYRARQFGRVTFWVLFAFMFLVVFVNIFSNSSAEGKKEETLEIEVNQATSQAAVEYAREFAKEYYTWKKGDGGRKDRRERLSKYLAEGLDADAGLDAMNLDWDSIFQSAELKKIDENGPNRSYITLKVKANLQKVAIEEIEKKVKEGDKEKVVKEKKEHREDKPFEKYFVVPIAYENGTYGVYELPKFTNMKEETNLKKTKAVGLTSYEGDREQVKEFLETFFSSYAQDNATKISYMLTENMRIEGLEGTLLYKGLTETNLYEDKKGSIIAFTKVKFTDPETGVTFTTDYQLSIKESDGKYLVSGFDDYNHKEQLTDDELEESKEDKENKNTEENKGDES
ncbi:conjugal transfer protein [Bacillus sp. FJAT-47783]|uniref:conjugal transfer protein n=1 Tax=Bacillus sp. FJAT-47783 TaxID=2922712 RepID=UPI001FACAF0F|nr:conjugal transfer protein [Bacillus sp. FJAT-47783]